MKIGVSREWVLEIIDKTTAFAKQLINDHFDRHVQDSVISREEKKLLHDIYGELWMQAYVDADNESISRFCKPLSDKMTELNKTLKFKK